VLAENLIGLANVEVANLRLRYSSQTERDLILILLNSLLIALENKTD
jgi:hypothetical protein